LSGDPATIAAGRTTTSRIRTIAAAVTMGGEFPSYAHRAERPQVAMMARVILGGTLIQQAGRSYYERQLRGRRRAP
jgi:hypothetical protein